MALVRILNDVCSALDELGIPYCIGGSLASSVWGEPRQTNDIDLAVNGSGADLQRLQERLGPDYYLSSVEGGQDYRMAQLTEMNEVIRFDLFLVGGSEFSKSEIARAEPTTIVPGVTARCASAEDIIIQKLRWYELGNRVSDRQWNDIVKVIEVQRGRLDWEYMRRWAQHFGLVELLEEADAEALD